MSRMCPGRENQETAKQIKGHILSSEYYLFTASYYPETVPTK